MVFTSYSLLFFQAVQDLISQLQAEVVTLTLSGVAESTGEKYAGLQRTFIEFCNLLGVLAVPAEEDTMVKFLAYLKSVRGLAAKSIGPYMAAVRHLHIINGQLDPSLNRPKVTLIRSAVTRGGGSHTDERLPLLFSDLLKFHQIALADPSYDSILFTAGCFVAYFGFLRISEFAAPERKSSKPGLRVCDVAFKVSWVELTLWDTKSDKSPKGVKIALAKRPEGPGPVRWLAEFIRRRPLSAESGLLFIHEDGRPMQKAWFRNTLKEWCGQVGLEGNRNSHSLRIGAATDAAAQGLTEGEIQRLGRWKSRAFMRYVRPSMVRQAALNLKFSPPLSF